MNKEWNKPTVRRTRRSAKVRTEYGETSVELLFMSERLKRLSGNAREAFSGFLGGCFLVAIEPAPRAALSALQLALNYFEGVL